VSNVTITWHDAINDAMNCDRQEHHLSYVPSQPPGHKWTLDDLALDALMDGYQAGVAENIFDNNPCEWVSVSEVMLQHVDDANVTLREYLGMRDQFPRMTITFSWAMAHHVLYNKYSSEVQLEILRACSEYPNTAAMCKYLFDNTLPLEIQTQVDEIYDRDFFQFFPIESYAEESQKRDWTALYG